MYWGYIFSRIGLLRRLHCRDRLTEVTVVPQEVLKVEQPRKALLFVILSPTGPYFTSGYNPVSLLADPKYVRAWPGGCGDAKMGSNYAPTLAIQVCGPSLAARS